MSVMASGEKIKYVELEPRLIDSVGITYTLFRHTTRHKLKREETRNKLEQI